MNRFTFSIIIAFLLTGCLSANNSPVSYSAPNILFIMGDDHTTQAISAYGGILAPYAQTRHIDQLAAEGLLFENVYCTNSICSPSRATILTGKYSHKNGVRILGQEFDGSQFTSQSALKQQGYQTAIFGKWHLRSSPTGFDDYKVLPVQGRYQDPQFHVKGSDSLVTYPGWSTDVISQMTLDFLDKREPNKPFFVMTHFKATHDPWASRPPYDTLWQNESLPEPANLYDEYENRSEAARRTTLRLEKINYSTYPHQRIEGADWKTQRGYIYQQYIKSFLRCGRVLDENVGKIIDYLKANNLYDNTIIIYTADQGHFLGEHGFFSKRFFYEEALRMPFIIRYPAWIAPGGRNQDMITNVDFAPTILEMAGVDIPEEVQGRSFLRNIKGETPDDWPQAMYYHYWQHLLHRDVTANYGIRTKNRKLIFYYGLALGLTEYGPTPPEWEMFDLEKDPMEMNNIYHDPAYQDEIKELKNQLIELQKKYDDRGEQYPELMEVQKNHFWE
ncbi:MAG: sulfatase [Bacteroidetes bacterium]|nr:sulfatase [Bacteroidota bacterium]